jgi:hypothetical protein
VKCKHEMATVLSFDLERERINVWCDNCKLGWIGATYEWNSNHPSHRRHKPPKWVLRLAEQARAALSGKAVE